MTLVEAAARLRVSVDQVQAWVADGLPMLEDGTCDPFLIGDWVADHRLADAPVLARRWRRFLRWFAPHAQGQDTARRVAIQREHRLYLPQEARGDLAAIRWHLPRLASWAGQSVEQDDVPGSQPTATHHRVTGGDAVVGQAQVTVVPMLGSAEELVPVVESVVADFVYTYRRHQPQDCRSGVIANGSCADLAVLLGERMGDLGRPWRLVSGVIATDALSNPHFWIEVAGPGDAWIPVDPTIPCMARRFPGLLAEMGGGDWRSWVRAWTGSLDARRVTLLRGESPVPHLPGGATGGSLIGESVVSGRNAWNCLDWVCGSCDWTFRSSAVSESAGSAESAE